MEFSLIIEGATEKVNKFEPLVSQHEVRQAPKLVIFYSKCFLILLL